METVEYIETAEGSEMQIKEVRIGNLTAGVNYTNIVNAVSNDSDSEFYCRNQVKVNSTTHQDEVPADAVLVVKTAVEVDSTIYHSSTAIGMSKNEMLSLYKDLQHILFEDIRR